MDVWPHATEGMRNVSPLSCSLTISEDKSHPSGWKDISPHFLSSIAALLHMHVEGLNVGSNRGADQGKPQPKIASAIPLSDCNFGRASSILCMPQPDLRGPSCHAESWLPHTQMECGMALQTALPRTQSLR